MLIAEQDLIDFIERPPRLELYRMWFTKVNARHLTGHVQGVAVHHDGRHTTIYISVSDFPRGWGGAIINDNRTYPESLLHGMEAMAFPQGNHPGGIAICDNFLAVPIEMDPRSGRVYLYSLDTPLYPRQVGHVDDHIDNDGLCIPHGVEADNTKASAAAMARLDGGRYLLAVLSEQRFLRFIPLECDEGGCLVGSQTGFVDGAEVDGWPDAFTDNISLINTTNGLHLVTFSVDKLIKPPKLPLLPELPPLVPSLMSKHTVTAFKVDTEFPDTPSIKLAACGRVELPPRLGSTDWLRPGFRWGASLGVFNGKPGITTVEYFGNEASRKDPVQYIQFASNIDPSTLNWSYGTEDSIVRGYLPNLKTSMEAKLSRWGSRIGR